jgi:hypothetical protein
MHSCEANAKARPDPRPFTLGNMVDGSRELNPIWLSHEGKIIMQLTCQKNRPETPRTSTPGATSVGATRTLDDPDPEGRLIFLIIISRQYNIG